MSKTIYILSIDCGSVWTCEMDYQAHIVARLPGWQKMTPTSGGFPGSSRSFPIIPDTMDGDLLEVVKVSDGYAIQNATRQCLVMVEEVSATVCSDDMAEIHSRLHEENAVDGKHVIDVAGDGQIWTQDDRGWAWHVSRQYEPLDSNMGAIGTKDRAPEIPFNTYKEGVVLVKYNRTYAIQHVPTGKLLRVQPIIKKD